MKTPEQWLSPLVNLDRKDWLEISSADALDFVRGIQRDATQSTILISKHEEKVRELEIKLSLWRSTFQKYQSWSLNEVPAIEWPQQVLFDYNKCAAIAGPDTQFIHISDAKVLVNQINRMPHTNDCIYYSPGINWHKFCNCGKNETLALAKQLNLTTEKGGG